jgi:hypothetical protein
MYKSQPPSQMLPPPELGTPPPTEQDPMASLMAGTAKVSPEMEYHQQRMNVLSALQRAVAAGGHPEYPKDFFGPADHEAVREMSKLMQIYSKLPGGAANTMPPGPNEMNMTPFGRDKAWAGANEELGVGNTISKPFDFGKTPAGRMK